MFFSAPEGYGRDNRFERRRNAKFEGKAKEA
jgi:hypothetical protein